MEAFLMHPLFIKIESATCICQTTIPNIKDYSILRPSLKSTTPFDVNVVEQSLKMWLERRRIGIISPKIGIIDLDKKHLLSVDILGEQGGQLVFIIIVSSDRRINFKQKFKLLKYCEGVQRQTLKIFKFEPCVYLVNIYGDGKISSSSI